MTRLCIGTVFKILSLSKRGGVSDKALGEVIFGGPYGENLNDAAINRIKNCVRDITDKAKENFSQWETEEKLDMANDIINNYLDANLLKETVLALQATVVEDDTINSSTIIGFDSKYKKASIERMSEFNFTSFLANVISYTYFNGHNAGNEEYSKRINKEFLKSFSEETRKIILVESVDKEELGNYQAVEVNKDNLDEYYVKLWLEYHVEDITRNGDGSKKDPLINMMVWLLSSSFRFITGTCPTIKNLSKRLRSYSSIRWISSDNKKSYKFMSAAASIDFATLIVLSLLNIMQFAESPE